MHYGVQDSTRKDTDSLAGTLPQAARWDAAVISMAGITSHTLRFFVNLRTSLAITPLPPTRSRRPHQAPSSSTEYE